MTEDELMQLIIKADPRPDVPELYKISGLDYRHFERFAALVEQRAAAAEREACAKVAERFGWSGECLHVAAAIRARAEHVPGA